MTALAVTFLAGVAGGVLARDLYLRWQYGRLVSRPDPKVAVGCQVHVAGEEGEAC